jgi:hypothetical protein
MGLHGRGCPEEGYRTREVRSQNEQDSAGRSGQGSKCYPRRRQSAGTQGGFVETKQGNHSWWYHARHVETVENLAAARERLKQVAHNASGDCFLYSTQRGIVAQVGYSLRHKIWSSRFLRFFKSHRPGSSFNSVSEDIRSPLCCVDRKRLGIFASPR